MLNFLSFLVLLYVSGHSKQKNFFSQFFYQSEKFCNKELKKFNIRKIPPYFQVQNVRSGTML